MTSICFAWTAVVSIRLLFCWFASSSVWSAMFRQKCLYLCDIPADAFHWDLILCRKLFGRDVFAFQCSEKYFQHSFVFLMFHGYPPFFLNYNTIAGHRGVFQKTFGWLYRKHPVWLCRMLIGWFFTNESFFSAHTEIQVQRSSGLFVWLRRQSLQTASLRNGRDQRKVGGSDGDYFW